MKLSIIYEGHWRTFGDVNPKLRKKGKKKRDLSFRIKGKKKISKSPKKVKDPKGGADKTGPLEIGAEPEGSGKIAGTYAQQRGPGEVRGGSDMDRLHGNGRVAGGELKAWTGNDSKGIHLK